MQKNRLLKIDTSDNVLVALVDLDRGIISYEQLSINLPRAVKQKHKFLTADLSKGEKIIMYGVPVGKANWELKEGEVLTIENVTHFADEVTIHEGGYIWQTPYIAKWEGRTFSGYSKRIMSLMPGDIISTGTPEGVGFGQKPPFYLKEGDVIELGIDGLGSAKQEVRDYAS